jgi:hypothetical protein
MKRNEQEWNGCMLSSESIRARSIQVVKGLGLIPPDQLPLSNERKIEKSSAEVANRLACLNAVVAVCFGCPPWIARAWIGNNQLEGSLTGGERSFLDCESPDESSCQQNELLLESIWALLWALGHVPTLDYGQYCGENLKSLAPQVGDKNQSAIEFSKEAELRCPEDIIQAEDLAYCLDWFAKQAERSGKSDLPVRAYVIRKRRHALSWILSKEAWDDVALDT